MYPFERREKILSLLHSSGQVNINRDAARLGVSRSTLHRDLRDFESQGLVKKVRGGAKLVDKDHFETHFDLRFRAMSKQKRDIALLAAPVVRDDSAIFLDHSSTTLYLAQELKNRFFRNLTVLTNSMVVAEALGGHRGMQVILTGGLVENEFKALSGRWVVESLKHLNLHQIFASVGAISAERGLMTQIPFISELLPELFRMGGEVNILADSSKFHKVGTFLVGSLAPGLKIFTDANLPDRLRQEVLATGATLIVG